MSASAPPQASEEPVTAPFDAIVLAGGHARRLGGVDKAMLRIGGQPLLAGVLAACSGARSVVVVGPHRPLPGVIWTRERPAGAGPLSAVAAGLDALPRPWSAQVVVLAADLPGLRAHHVQRLLACLAAPPAPSSQRSHAAAVAVDGRGRWQPLLAAYRTATLDQVLAIVGDLTNGPVRWLPERLNAIAVRLPSGATADIDTTADLEAIVLEGWVQQLCGELGVDAANVDVTALLDVARESAHHVARPSAPITTFIVGYAAASRGGGPQHVRECAEAAQRLALTQTPVEPDPQ